MKYKFEQFGNLEITPTSIEVKSVDDNVIEKIASVTILLVSGNTKYGVTFQGFKYLESWEDCDIKKWVQLELEKFKV